MAQTKRKRRSKHRGTAAGSIESRGRTGRPSPTKAPTKQQARQVARERRLNTPPTWRSSLTRSGFAAVCLFVFILVTTKAHNRLVAAASLALIVLLVYVPAGYFLERFLWRRRMAKRAAEAKR